MDNREELEYLEASTTDEFIRELLEDEQDGAGFAAAYLKAGALSSGVEALYKVRKSTGLTQIDIARKLNTKQPAIARLEADVGGKMSLRRYAEFAFACGKVPLLMLEDIGAVQNYVLDQPDGPLTADYYMTWKLMSRQPSVEPRIEAASLARAVPSTLAMTSWGGITGQRPDDLRAFYDLVVRSDAGTTIAMEVTSTQQRYPVSRPAQQQQHAPQSAASTVGSSFAA